MAEIVLTYAKATASLEHATKQRNVTQGAYTAIKELEVAARTMVRELIAGMGKLGGRDLKETREAVPEAQRCHQHAAAELAAMEDRLEEAEQGLAAAEAAFKTAEARFGEWLAGVTNRANAGTRRAAEEFDSTRRRANAHPKGTPKRKWSGVGGFGPSEDDHEHWQEFSEEQRRSEEESSRAQNGPQYSYQKTYTPGEDTFGAQPSGATEIINGAAPHHNRRDPSLAPGLRHDLPRQTHMRAFPEPPAEACTNKACATETDRALKACKCNLRKIFTGQRNLKQDRARFHPDRFGTCPEDVKEDIQEKAKEVFVIVSAMFSGK